MTVTLTASAELFCIFALGCALIQAAQGHAEVVTRVLSGVAVIATVLVLLVGSLAYGPDEASAGFDGITVYAAP